MSSYWKHLWAALRGQTTDVGGVEPDARSRMATLEMDVQERDEQIQQMKREYASLVTSKEQGVTGAGQEYFERLFKKLAGPLSNLSILASLADEGKDVTATDMASLVRSVEKVLAANGLEPIGHLGERTKFDTSSHQRMSGGTVHSGTAVTVRIPGYKFSQRVIQKAMVSAEESHGESGN